MRYAPKAGLRLRVGAILVIALFDYPQTGEYEIRPYEPRELNLF